MLLFDCPDSGVWCAWVRMLRHIYKTPFCIIVVFYFRECASYVLLNTKCFVQSWSGVRRGERALRGRDVLYFSAIII